MFILFRNSAFFWRFYTGLHPWVLRFCNFDKSHIQGFKNYMSYFGIKNWYISCRMNSTMPLNYRPTCKQVTTFFLQIDHNNYSFFLRLAITTCLLPSSTINDWFDLILLDENIILILSNFLHLCPDHFHQTQTLKAKSQLKSKVEPPRTSNPNTNLRRHFVYPPPSSSPSLPTSLSRTVGTPLPPSCRCANRKGEEKKERAYEREGSAIADLFLLVIFHY